MCILFLHVDPDPLEGNFRLIVATNRDEYYSRPAQPATRDAETNIIAGLDMEPGREGGMWCGFRTKEQQNGQLKKHCFSAILNISGEMSENADGRGCLVKDYLTTTEEFPEYIQQLEKTKNFNGFNLVAVELSKNDAKTYHHGNRPPVDSVYTGKHTLGFGNSPSFCPLNKVCSGRYKFMEILDAGYKSDELTQRLLNLLKDQTSYLPDAELQTRHPNNFEVLGSMFVKAESSGYGTRTHSVILIDYHWNMEFIEHTMAEPIQIKNPKWTKTKITARL